MYAVYVRSARVYAGLSEWSPHAPTNQMFPGSKFLITKR